jgi:hypothetical protein
LPEVARIERCKVPVRTSRCRIDRLVVKCRLIEIEEETMLRALLGSAVLVLSACSTTPQPQSTIYDPIRGTQVGGSFSLGPVNARDPRLLDPHFYMDDDLTPRWLVVTPQPNR